MGNNPFYNEINIGERVFKIKPQPILPPIDFQTLMGPWLDLSVQMIHYKKLGYSLVAWDMDKREYYFQRGFEKRTIKMTKHEIKRMAQVWNAYFYGRNGGSGPLSEEFYHAMRRFARGRVTREMIRNRVLRFSHVND